jgi:iron complex outermembrane receptor protein
MMRVQSFRAAASPLAFASVLCAGSALAQDVTPATALPPDTGTIVVTGSLIGGPAEDAPAPVDVIDAEELARQGSPSILELTRRLAVSSGVLADSSQFDGRSQFAEGGASINLRGLGPQRTLVLLNGRRVAASGSASQPFVDLNLLPMDAVSRLEILKDGAAATYGSDAIAGVVNIITRTRQQGFQASAGYRHIDGSDGDWNAGLSWGGEIGPARLFLSGGYQRRHELQVLEREGLVRPYPENPQGGYSGGGNPGNFDYNAALGGIAFTADEGCEALGGFRSLPGSTEDLCLTNYLGFTNLIEPEERYQLFADAELELGDRATLRLTGLYGRLETSLSTSPSFLPTIAPSSAAAFGGSGLFVIPQYAPALIDYCARFGPASDCAVGANGTPLAPALAYPVRFRPLLTGGNPLFDNDRNTATAPRDSDSYQATAELRVDMGTGLELTASGTYSEYDRYFEVADSFVDLLQNALAGFGGPNCAYADPRARAGLTPAQLAAVAGTGGCTWFNPFSSGVPGNALTGAGNPNFAGNGSPAGLSTVPGAGLVNDVATIGHFYNIWGRVANTQQWVADMVLSGSSGVILPAGEVSFAIGGQYRKDRYARRYEGGNNLELFPCPGSVLDPNATCNPQTGALGFIGSNRDVTVSGDVGAVFGELRLPVTDRLLAQISARYEDYGARGGASFDPQARIRFELNDWLVLRGGAGTTFRGPPPQNALADLVVLTFIGGAFRAIDLLGNPNLKPERATTYNAGLVVDRGGLRAGLDYWRYAFKGPIEAEPVSGIVSALFGASGNQNCGDPAFAALQARFLFSGGVCSAANVQRLTTYAFNSADVTTSGLDLSASYDRDLGGAQLQAGFNTSYTIEFKLDEVMVEGIPVQPAFDAAGKLNYQTTAYPLPRVKGSAWLEGEIDGHSLRLQLNHVGSYTDQRGPAVFGPNPSLAGASVTTGKRIDTFTTLDATWLWRLETGTSVSIALFNIFDTAPPFARLDQNFDPFTASPLGFTARMGVSQAF